MNRQFQPGQEWEGTVFTRELRLPAQAWLLGPQDPWARQDQYAGQGQGRTSSDPLSGTEGKAVRSAHDNAQRHPGTTA